MATLTESQYPRDWFRIAAKDFARVAKRIKEGDKEDAAFRLQQAIEKYLKGYLLARGWTLKRIHDIEALLSDAVRVDPALERYRALCQRVAGYYLIERYPMFEEGPSSEEVRNTFVEARRLVRHLKSHVEHRKTRPSA